MSVLGPIADDVANWQRRFKPTRHHVAGAGSRAGERGVVDIGIKRPAAWAFSQQVVDRSTFAWAPWHIDGRETVNGQE
jgi:hypothetical protein